MRTTYKVLPLDDENYCDSERMGVYRCVDDKPVELLGVDGGEPEDNTFSRDWYWVPLALQNAYDRGKNE